VRGTKNHGRSGFLRPGQRADLYGSHSSGRALYSYWLEESLTAKSAAYIYLAVGGFTGHYSGNIHFRLEKFLPCYPSSFAFFVISTIAYEWFRGVRARRRNERGELFLPAFSNLMPG